MGEALISREGRLRTFLVPCLSYWLVIKRCLAEITVDNPSSLCAIIRLTSVERCVVVMMSSRFTLVSLFFSVV